MLNFSTVRAMKKQNCSHLQKGFDGLLKKSYLFEKRAISNVSCKERRIFFKIPE